MDFELESRDRLRPSQRPYVAGARISQRSRALSPTSGDSTAFPGPIQRYVNDDEQELSYLSIAGVCTRICHASRTTA